MTYTNVRDAIVLGPGEGRRIPGPEGIVAKATGKAFGFLEATTEPEFGPPRQIHYGCDELFYVLAGRFEFVVGERRVEATTGSFVLIPRGTVHAPRVVGPEPGSVLIAFVPGGAEQIFDDLAELTAETGGPPDPDDERVRALVGRYDSEIVGPPL